MPEEVIEWEQDGEVVKAHYSSLTLHRKCPQAWFYRYDQGLSRDVAEVAAPERDFGSWFGAWAAAEALERGRMYDSLVGPMKKFRSVDGIEKFDAATVIRNDVFLAADAWWEHQSQDAKAEWDARLGGELPALLSRATDRWMDEWSEQRRRERPLGVELFWQRNLPKPAADAHWDAQANGLTIGLIGFIDELYWDSERDLVVARDRKTAKALGTQSAVDDMMDSQLGLYAWGIQPWLKQNGLDPVRALAYDRMRSIQPKPPQLTLSGKLAVRGGEPSTSNTDLQTYLEWSKGPDGNGVPWGEQGAYFASGPRKGEPKFGFYTAEDSVVEKLSQPAQRSIWFQRTLVPLSTHVVRSHLRSAVDTGTDIWRTEQRAERTGEAARNFAPSNCKWCDYASLCRAQMIGGPEGEYELAEHGLRSREGLKIIGVS